MLGKRPIPVPVVGDEGKLTKQMHPRSGTGARQPPHPHLEVQHRRWTFSFRFWKQDDFFGLGDQDAKWFVSLLDKLNALSKELLEKFLGDHSMRNTWRYHEIDWTSQNIPIQRADLTWVDAAYRNNEDEFPLYQFQISTALGRVVGFWDEVKVFNVILLDPLHNIQPAGGKFAYKVSPTTPLPCLYSSLLFQLKEVQSKECGQSVCPILESVKLIPGTQPTRRVVILQFDIVMSPVRGFRSAERNARPAGLQSRLLPHLTDEVETLAEKPADQGQTRQRYD